MMLQLAKKSNVGGRIHLPLDQVSWKPHPINTCKMRHVKFLWIHMNLQHVRSHVHICSCHINHPIQTIPFAPGIWKWKMLTVILKEACVLSNWDILSEIENLFSKSAALFELASKWQKEAHEEGQAVLIHWIDICLRNKEKKPSDIPCPPTG